MFERKRLFSLAPLYIGAVFLFNGNYGVIDVLPDFIGYLIIFAGIWRLSDINEAFSEARKYLLILSLTTAVRFAVIVVVDNNDNNAVMLLTTVFVCLEIVTSYILFKNIFKGLDFICKLDAGYTESSNIRVAQVVSLIFVTIKQILNILPELLTLFDNTTYGWVTNEMRLSLYEAKPSVVFACIIISTLFGIVWMSVVIPPVRRLQGNEHLMDRLNAMLTDMFSSHRVIFTKRLNFTAAACSAGLIFWIDMVVDNVNIIPDFIGVILILAAYNVAVKLDEELRIPNFKAVSSVAMLSSAAAYVLNYIYYSNYTEDILSGTDNSYLLFASYGFTALLAGCAFFLCFGMYKIFLRLKREEEKSKSKAVWILAAVFLLKALKFLLPENGLIYFLYTLIFVVFAVISARYINSLRQEILILRGYWIVPERTK